LTGSARRSSSPEVSPPPAGSRPLAVSGQSGQKAIRRHGKPAGSLGGVHKTTGVRDPAAAFPLPGIRNDAADRRAANRAVAVSAIGLAGTGLIEVLLAIVTGSVGLLGDAIHNLSDVSTSAVVFLGFRLSRRPASERYPYGLERAEDRPGSASPSSSGPARRSPVLRASASCSSTGTPPMSAGASPARRSASSATRPSPGTS
jgi:hypothetical protein